VAAKRARKHQDTQDTDDTAGGRVGGSPDQQHVGVTLLVDDDSLGDLDGVLRRVREAGLRDGQVLPAAGVITGTAHPDTLHELSQVRGIRAAEVDRTIQLPPPDQPQ